jgi:hypothetical protein
MAELASLLRSGAVVEPLRAVPPVAAVNLLPLPASAPYPAVKPERRRKRTVRPQSHDARVAAKAPLNKTGRSAAPGDDAAVQQWDEAIVAAAKSAKDYRSWVLGNVALYIRAASEFHEAQLPTAAGMVGDVRVKASELINANVNAALDYARQLTSVQSPAEFVALSTSHAVRHFELIARHAAAFALLKGR